MTCPTCHGRGWINDGSSHGVTCPACTDPNLIGLVKRAASKSVRHGWYSGKRTSKQHRSESHAVHRRRRQGDG